MSEVGLFYVLEQRNPFYARCQRYKKTWIRRDVSASLLSTDSWWEFWSDIYLCSAGIIHVRVSDASQLLCRSVGRIPQERHCSGFTTQSDIYLSLHRFRPSLRAGIIWSNCMFSLFLWQKWTVFTLFLWKPVSSFVADGGYAHHAHCIGFISQYK